MRGEDRGREKKRRRCKRENRELAVELDHKVGYLTYQRMNVRYAVLQRRM